MIPLSPSTLGVCDAPAPQPPRAASGRVSGRRGRRGRRAGGRRATQNSRRSKDTCRLESQGGGQAQQERREEAATGDKACRPGEIGRAEMEAEGLWGCRKEKLPSGGGGERSPPQDRDIYGLRRKGKGPSPQTFFAEGDPGVHSPCPFATDQTPDTPAHTPYPSIRTTARAPRHSRDSASGPRQSTPHRQARPGWGLSRPRGGSLSSAPGRPMPSQGGGRGALETQEPSA